MRPLLRLLFIFQFFISLNGYSQSGWVRTFGGNEDDYGQTCSVDPAGNVFIGGRYTGSVNFDSTQTGFLVSSYQNMENPYFLKMDSEKNVLWVRTWEGHEYSEVSASCVDQNGNSYIVGNFINMIDLDTGPNTNYTSSQGTGGIFITKFNVNGDQIWSEAVVIDSNQIESHTIDVTADGHLKISGFYSGAIDFDPGTGTQIITSESSGGELFVLDLDVNGNFNWVIHTPTNASYTNSFPIGADIDAVGNYYIVSTFLTPTDFDPGPDTLLVNPGPNGTSAILKLNSSGHLTWAHFLDNAMAADLVLDHSGNLIIAGSFITTVDFDLGPGVHNITAPDYNLDAFTLKMDTSINAGFEWVNTLSGVSDQYAVSLAIGPDETIYETGFFTDSTWIHYNAFNWSTNSSIPAGTYVTILKPDGNFEGVFTNHGMEAIIRCSDLNQVYIAGNYQGDADMNLYPDQEDIHHSTAYTQDIYVIGLPNGLLGIPNQVLKDVVLYPNPALTEIRIPVKSSEKYSIYDLTGRQQLTGITLDGVINIRLLNPGTYIIQTPSIGMKQFVKY